MKHHWLEYLLQNNILWEKPVITVESWHRNAGSGMCQPEVYTLLVPFILTVREIPLNTSRHLPLTKAVNHTIVEEDEKGVLFRGRHTKR